MWSPVVFSSVPGTGDGKFLPATGLAIEEVVPGWMDSLRSMSWLHSQKNYPARMENPPLEDRFPIENEGFSGCNSWKDHPKR